MPRAVSEGLESELPDVERLALAHAPRGTRKRVFALLAFDARLAGIVRQAREPLLGQMRLAWWRDHLAKPCNEWPKGEPLLELLSEWQCPAALAALADGWEGLLRDSLDEDAIRSFAEGREKAWLALAAEIGARSDPAPAARAWALADLAANLSDPDERAQVLEVAGKEKFPLPTERALRPLAILGGLGRRSLARGGTPLLDGRGAALAALRLGMFGR